MRLVPTNCVKEGSKLGRDINNEKGSILLKKGISLTSSLLEKIEASGVYMIYIDDKYSNIEINDIIRPELRQKAMFAIKDTFQSMEKINNSLLQENINFQKKIIAKSMEKYVSSLRDVSKKIIEEILSNRSLMINLVDIKNIDNYTYEHSLNVAILSLVLSIESKLPKSDLYKIFIGALLHDIGKAFLPASITKKKGPLTDEEAEFMEKHTQLGYDYLKESYGIDPKSRLVCLQHHELSDGSGYPSGHYSSQIHKFSKIVAIANVYDEMTSDTPDSRALPPNEVIEFLYASAGTIFDFDLVEMFCRKINPYPEGTLVELSNKKIGIVKSVNINFPLRPIIKIFEARKSINQLKEIDLMKETNITILKIKYEDPDTEIK